MIDEPDGHAYADYPQFRPRYTPFTMLRMGVFGGAFFPSEPSKADIPYEWFSGVHSSESPNPSLNRFGVLAGDGRPKLAEAARVDPLGWFQWYCRFHLGRRNQIDHIQISRWANYGMMTVVRISKCSDLDSMRILQQSMLQCSHDPWVKR